MRRLYHYTCIEHLPSILDERVLRTTESNVSFDLEHEGPDVVWLSTDPSRPPRDSWTHGSILDKTRIRIIVNIAEEDVYKWTDWLPARNSPRWVRRGLILSGGGTHDDWYVVERPVKWNEIVEIRDMDRDMIVGKEEKR